MSIPKELLAILVCPVCKSPVHLVADSSGLKCDACKRIYPDSRRHSRDAARRSHHCERLSRASSMKTELARAIPRLKRLLPRFRKVRVAVLGDLMLDRYLWGTADRLSPGSGRTGGGFCVAE